MRAALLVVLLASSAAACSFDPAPPLDKPRDGGDAGDAGFDGGPDDQDGGIRDTGLLDAQNLDAAVLDGGDGGARDGGDRDGGDRDGGDRDGGDLDGGDLDGAVDSGLPPDAGDPDAGPLDTGVRDGGVRDGGASTTTELVWLTANPMIEAGACSTPLRVQRRNAAGTAANDPIPLTLLLDRSGVPFTFHNPGCSAVQINAVTIPAGNSIAEFAVSGTQAGTGGVQVTSLGLNRLDATLFVDPAAPAQLVYLTGSSTVAWGTCSSAVTIQRQDAYGNPAAPSFSTFIDVTSAPAGGLDIFSDAACANATTNADIASMASTATFYFRPRGFGSLVLEATPVGLPAISQTHFVGDCPDACGAQCSECCFDRCAGGGCNLNCAGNACPCELDCAAGGSCSAICDANDCGVECPAGAPCVNTCLGGSTCTVDCRNSSSCSVSCAAGSCRVFCPTLGCNVTCANPISCGNNIVVCNGVCP